MTYNTIDVINGRLFINGVEISLEDYNKIVTEEIDKEVLEDLRLAMEQKKNGVYTHRTGP